MNFLDHLYLLFPLSAAMVYAFGSMGLRAAAQDGGSPWQAMLLTNVIAGILFQVYLKGDPTPELPAEWLDVAVLGGVFFFGNVLTVLALSLGFDVGLQFLSNRDGFHRVGPYAVGMSGVMSLLLFPVANRSAPDRSSRGRRFLWIGAGLLSFQSMILIYSLGHYNDAAGINIVYGSRGLWGLVMVGLAGHWFSNREKELAKGLFRYRVAGACCMTGAIAWAMA